MNLKGLRCYLIGPIDCCPNGGTEWRRMMTNYLTLKEVVALDPTNKPIVGYDETEEWIKYRKELKTKGQYGELKKLVRKVRAVDLRMCDVCDFCIVYLDLSIPMCGTWEELFWCNRMKKPCLIVCKQGKNNIPDWLFGTLPDEYMFSSFIDLQIYIDYVNSEEFVDNHKRWVFFNFNQ